MSKPKEQESTAVEDAPLQDSPSSPPLPLPSSSASLSASAKKTPALTITTDDSLDTVFNALKLFPDDESIVSQVFDYLSSLSRNEYGHDGTTDAVTGTTVASSGQKFTSWLLHRVKLDTRSCVRQMGGIPLVIAAMQQHPSLKEKAQRALLDLLPIRPADGVQKIVETMNKVSAVHYIILHSQILVHRLIAFLFIA